jgi:uncharacterized membrane protein HdeD (DUF308 family)
MLDTVTDDATLRALERGTASLPDIAGNAVRQRVAALLRRPVRDDAASATTRGVLAIATGVAAILWPETSLGAMLVVFGAYAAIDAILAIATAISGSVHRWRLIAQAAVDIVAIAFTLIRPDLTHVAALTLLAVWVVAMGALRLRDAIDLDGGVRVNVLLAVLALLAIVAGAGALVSPNDHLDVVVLNVWIFTILRGVTLLAPPRQQPSRSTRS